MKVYQTLLNEQDIRTVLREATNYEVWARLSDRDDSLVMWESDVRTVNGQLQINAGEYDVMKNTRLNDEWLVPRFVYVKHQCDNCHYPPSMCCLQASDFRDFDDYGRDNEAEEDLFKPLPVATQQVEE